MRSWSTFTQQNNWDNIINKPSILNDGLISWGEIQNKPIESGIFTPKLIDQGNYNYVQTLKQGHFHKIDKLIQFTIRLTIDTRNKGNSTHWLRIADFPYTFSDVGEQWFTGAGSRLNISNPYFASVPNTNQIGLYVINSNVLLPFVTMTPNNLYYQLTAYYTDIFVSGLALVD